jgi:hypothetical protein
MWTFSIYLEAVAIFPQLFMLQRTGEAETITSHYLAALGVYRALYIPNWIYRYVTSCGHVGVALNAVRLRHCRYFTEDVVDPIAVVAGLVQTGLYIDFFYVYVTKCVAPPPFSIRTHGVSTCVLGGAEYCKDKSLNYQHECSVARTACYTLEAMIVDGAPVERCRVILHDPIV